VPDSRGEKRSPEALVAEYATTRASDLRDLIVTQHASMVERIARRFAGPSEPTEDLAQVGFIGLLNALELYDPEKGVKFSTYATHLVAGEIKHHLRDRGKIIKEPAWLQELNQRINRVVQALAQELGRQPTPAEIAANMHMTEEAVTEVLMTRDIFRVVSIDAPAEDDESDSPYDLDKMDGCEEHAFSLPVEDKMVLETAIIQLKEIERKVVHLFFYEGLNQTEIAHQLKISCNYVSHILRHSVQKLRKILITEDLKDRRLRSHVPEPTAQKVVDDQTGLLGPDYFNSRVSEEMQRASSLGTRLAVIVVQFAGLEQLREFYGDMTVGEFLAEAAGVIRGALRNVDILCRAGEYAFGVILPYVERISGDISSRLEKPLIDWIRRLFSAQSQVAISVGRADYPADGLTLRDLMVRAWDSPPTTAMKDAA
jgi:RNA polymerase sigma-B factor